MLTTTADKLRYYRYQKSLLQREVAEYAGINESTYIDYESGNRDYYPIDKIRRIADLLEIPTETLLDEYNLFLCNQTKTLKALREQCGWTQSQLAEKLSIRLHTVKQWEQGRVRMTRKMWERLQNLMPSKSVRSGCCCQRH
ncbi:MAG: helix-turn-helix transcriptional regulator [Acutalibacter sp.]|nr:helix-turn-helix transcriptional regulator [Acutalibacter sp.]